MKHIRKITSVAALIIVLSCSVYVVNAQSTPEATTSRSNTSFGIKGGVNLSNLYVDDVNDENAKLGFQLGFFAKAGITESFAIQPEFIYSLKGASLKYDNIFASGRTNFNLHYIEVPVLAVINFGNFNIHAGPYFSYLAGVTVKDKSDDGDSDFEREIDKDNFEAFDYGLAGGFGAEGDGIGFGIRYNYGLKEIGKEKQVFWPTLPVPQC